VLFRRSRRSVVTGRDYAAGLGRSLCALRFTGGVSWGRGGSLVFKAKDMFSFVPVSLPFQGGRRPFREAEGLRDLCFSRGFLELCPLWSFQGGCR